MKEKKREDKMDIVIESLKTMNITKSCEEAGITRKTLYTWREKYKEFDDIVEEVISKKLDNQLVDLIDYLNKKL